MKNMKNKTLSITLVAILTLSSFGLLFTTLLTPAAAASEPMPLLDRMPIDATPEMIGEKEISMRKRAAEIGAAAATGASPVGNPAVIGEVIEINVADFVEGNYNETFVVLLENTHLGEDSHGIICIEKAAYDNYDEATDEYVFPNPYGIWRPEDRISTTKLQYLLDEFDHNIYPTDTAVFGDPLPRGDEGQKCWVLIHNIRDESYYGDYEYYVAGYFSSAEDAENNKNMFHMDTYDWQNRTGPDSARPYLYEGVFAHEFQHLIHFDQDPDEPSWVDEACADMAAFLCGYGHSSGHIAYYFMRHFFTPLTFWGGDLADYGASYLWALYMYDHFGGADFFTTLVQEQANGIEGVENTLDTLGYWWIGFDEIFDRWTIANYIDEEPKHKRRGPSKYGYESIDIGSEDTWGYTIEYWIVDDNYYWNWVFDYHFGMPDMWIFPIYEAPFEVTEDDWPFYWYGYPMPYTAQYFRFNNDKLSKITFDGADTADVLPPSGAYEWYSGVGAWAWRSFSQSFSIPATGNTSLNFKTFYEIEGDWDYGYVEVYDGTNWFTLYAPETVDYLVNPQMSENCPDEREPITYEAAGSWYGFTGYSAGWEDISMDLTPFAGLDIDLYFTTWQDGAFTLQMMYIDDIEITNDISGTLFFDNVEAGEAGWANNGWEITDGIYPNGWSFNVITTNNVNPDRYPNTNSWKLLRRRKMWMNSGTQSGTMWVSKTPSTTHKFNVAIVSNHADHIIASNYHFSVELFSWKWWKWC